eukprot:1074200-Pyramimonas_sp.AAC.1
MRFSWKSLPRGQMRSGFREPGGKAYSTRKRVLAPVKCVRIQAKAGALQPRCAGFKQPGVCVGNPLGSDWTAGDNCMLYRWRRRWRRARRYSRSARQPFARSLVLRPVVAPAVVSHSGPTRVGATGKAGLPYRRDTRPTARSARCDGRARGPDGSSQPIKKTPPRKTKQGSRFWGLRGFQDRNSESLGATQVMGMLDRLYDGFDKLCVNFGLFK